MPELTHHRPDPLDATPIRVAVVVSVLVHAALILELPPLHTPLTDPPGEPQRLTVLLVPRPGVLPDAVPPPPARPGGERRRAPPSPASGG